MMARERKGKWVLAAVFLVKNTPVELRRGILFDLISLTTVQIRSLLAWATEWYL